MNLFKGFSKAGDEEIIDQISLLRQINLKNLSKVKANKAVNKVTNLFNKISDKISDKVDGQSKLNYDFRFSINSVKEISDYIEEEKNGLLDKTRTELDNILKAEIVKRFKTAKDDNKDVTCLNEEELSEKVINTAFKWDKLNIAKEEDLELDYKAKLIVDRFKELLLQEIKKYGEKMNQEQKRNFEIELDKQLDKMSQRRRADIKRALQVNELSGEIIRQALFKSGGSIAFLGILQLSGFSAYILLTTIMHALFTTFLGITLPFAAYTTATSTLAFVLGPFGMLLALGMGAKQIFKGNKILNRMLFAQVVWFSVSYMDIDIEEDNLPDWLPDRERDYMKALESETSTLINKLAKLEEEKLEIEQEKMKTEREKIRIEEKANLKEEKFNTKLKKINQQLKEKEKQLAEVKKEDNVQEELISLVEDEKNSLEEEKEELIEVNLNLELEKETAIQEKETAKLELDRREKEIERLELKAKSSIEDILKYFKTIKIGEKAYQNIINLNLKQRDKFIKELMKIEKQGYHPDNLNLKVIKSLNNKNIYETRFGYQGRVYFECINRRYVILRVGDKNSQSRDIAWLKRCFG